MIEFPEGIREFAVAGLDEGQIVELENTLRLRFPPEYRQFLRQSDGLSVAGGLLVYGSEDIQERNETWEVTKYAPGCVAIGDVGGGRVFLMKLDPADSEIYAVDAGSMDPSMAETIAETFAAWVATKFGSNDDHR